MMALFFLLTSVYMITYSGRLQFNDELQMLDVTGSIVEFGDERYDLALWYVWTLYGPFNKDIGQRYALPTAPVEPMQSVAGVPFYWFSRLVDGTGTVHTVWLVNVLVTAAVGVLFFRFALLLGYDVATALIAALLLAFGTALWPYSRTFLREPLMAFFLLLAAYLLEQSNRGSLTHRRTVLYLAGVGIAMAFAFLTKESTLMVLPALLALRFPVFTHHPRWRRVLDISLIALLLLPLLLVITDILGYLIPQEVSLTALYALQPAYAREALHTYLFSVGGSIWGTSPVVLLAVPGLWLLYRAQKRRCLWMIVLSVIGLAVGHAITAGEVWSGGATWPPRFLIPVLPLLMLAVLPVLGLLRHVPVLRVPVVLLVLYSLWWQVNGLAFPWESYSRLLPAESNGLSEWSAGLNTLRYMRPSVLSTLWFEQPLDFAWVRTGVHLWPLLFVGLSVAAAILVWRPGRSVWLLPGAWIVFSVLGLRMIVDDPLYLGEHEALHHITERLKQEEQSGDVVLLNTPQYHGYFLNHAGLNKARIVSLPLAPGERGSFEENPGVVFDDPVELLRPETVDLLRGLAIQRERLWLLMDAGPFLPWRIRPLERYMADRYYPIRELNPEPPNAAVRLLEFSTIKAESSERATVKATDLVFGESIAAASFMLPQGTAYRVGAVLPLTIFWQTDRLLAQNYNIALFLADQQGNVVFADGRPVQGWDTPPAAGFAPMPEWEPGEYIKDNRALRLPEDLPPGEYELLLRLYTPESGGEDALSVSGAGVISDGLAALPVTVVIE